MKKIETQKEKQAKKFAKEFVSNGMVATKAYQKIKPHKKGQEACSESGRYMRKKHVRKSILELLPDDEVDSEIIHGALTAERPTTISWRDLHKYVTTSLKLKGYLDNDKNDTNVNVALVIRK